MTSKVTRAFREELVRLPAQIQRLAHKDYQLWLGDIGHASIRFKRLRGSRWPARVGDHYRAVGYFEARGLFVWTWIGIHEEYNKL